MSDFILTTESPADLSKEYYEETGIPYIPYHFQVHDGELLTDIVGQGMTEKELSDMMAWFPRPPSPTRRNTKNSLSPS